VERFAGAWGLGIALAECGLAALFGLAGVLALALDFVLAFALPALAGWVAAGAAVSVEG
jgi:hypothetical protein